MLDLPRAVVISPGMLQLDWHNVQHPPPFYQTCDILLRQAAQRAGAE
jgi:hypothetical protein